MPDPHYLYVVVRKDLSLRQQAVQAAHAALEAKHHLGLSWTEHPNLVLCGVEDLSQLLQCSASLREAQVEHRLFVEPDQNNEPTALATCLLQGAARRCLRKYPLLTFNEESAHGKCARNCQ